MTLELYLELSGSEDEWNPLGLPVCPDPSPDLGFSSVEEAEEAIGEHGDDPDACADHPRSAVSVLWMHRADAEGFRRDHDCENVEVCD